MSGVLNIVRRGFLVLLILLPGLIGGCLGVSAPEDRFYRLELPKPDTRLDPPPLQGTLQVTRPWADALTGERYLVYRTNHGTSELERHAYDRWVDSPTLLLQQEMARYLRDIGIADQVVMPEHRARADFILVCNMAKLERVLNGMPRVVMELELSITQMRNREPLLLKLYHEEQPAADQSMDASILAYNHVLASILNRFVEDVSALSAKANQVPGSPE